MNVAILCEAVEKSLPFLNGARNGKAIDHSFVELFQNNICKELNSIDSEYRWVIEKRFQGRSEKDSIDIFGHAKNKPNWIIEIDATRSDQLSQKFLSRLALWGLKTPIQYVAILYPDTQNGKSSCEKYLRYCGDVVKRINSESSVTGIFVDPADNSIEVHKQGKNNRDHFDVNGKECKSMGEAAEEAIRFYLKEHPEYTFEQIKQYWGFFIDDEFGTLRYTDIHVRSYDGIPIHTYSQFRQYGVASYWNRFVKLCKNAGIIITKMRMLCFVKDEKIHYRYSKL